MATSFEQEVSAGLGADEQRALRRLRWHNRLSSLWAPVTIFGLAFLVYLLIVELHTPSYRWAQPALKGFGLVMLAWFAGLIPARGLFKGFGQPRKLRHQGWELLSEVARLADRYRDKLTPKARAELVSASSDLLRAMTVGNPAVLDDQLRKAAGVADRHLATWRKQSTFDFAMGFVKAFAIAMAIRTVLLEPFRIPSGSMIPTLEIGDQIFVNKFIYGVRIPFTNVVPFVIVRPPARGDVIVFNNPVDTSKDFIKRVVGLGGDVVEIIDDVVHINGKPQPRQPLVGPEEEQTFAYWDKEAGPWMAHQVRQFEETVDGRTYLTAQRPWGRGPHRQGPWTVPQGHVFVLGDNRDNSSDSRLGLGVTHKVEFVPHGNIKGKAMVIWLAIGHGGLGSGLFEGTGLKTARFFQPVR